MRPFRFKNLVGQILALLVLLATTGFGPEPAVTSPISPEEFVRAMVTDRTPVLDLYFDERMNPNARGAQERPLLLAATLEQDAVTVTRLLEAGASADLADENGLTPLMAAAMQGNMDLVRKFVGNVTNIHATDRNGRSALEYAVTAQKSDVVQFLLRVSPDVAAQADNLVSAALATSNREIIGMIFDRVPVLPEWTAKTRRALDDAIASGNQEQMKLLIKKHATTPTPQDRMVPLLAYAIAQNDTAKVKALLGAGIDANTVLPLKCDRDFLDLVKSNSFRGYIEEDKNVTVLMVAAGLGQVDSVRALLEAGADRNRSTARYKMMALYLAAEQGNWQCTQILLGGGPVTGSTACRNFARHAACGSAARWRLYSEDGLFDRSAGVFDAAR